MSGLARRRRAMRAIGSLGDDATEIPVSPVPIMRSAIAASAGRRRAGSTPYYRFAAMPISYPFDWHGWPGGVPSSSPAAETRALSGGGDLIESGLNPYTIHNPALAHRGLRMPGQPLAGIWGDLSTSERKAITVGAAAALAAVGWIFIWKRAKPRRNPARRIRRGRKKRSHRARRRRWRR